MTAISDLVQMHIEHVAAALSPLHSLIYIPSSQHLAGHISILHASFYDFISNQALSSKHCLDPGASHKSLAYQCLSLMDREWLEKKNISYLTDRKDKEISEPLAYACGNWAFHFTKTNNNNGSIELKHFL